MKIIINFNQACDWFIYFIFGLSHHSVFTWKIALRTVLWVWEFEPSLFEPWVDFNIKCIGKLPGPTDKFERSLVFETGEFERPEFERPKFNCISWQASVSILLCLLEIFWYFCHLLSFLRLVYYIVLRESIFSLDLDLAQYFVGPDLVPKLFAKVISRQQLQAE